MLYQRTGRTNFDELWLTDSTLNEGTDSLVNMRIGAGRMVCRALLYNKYHQGRSNRSGQSGKCLTTFQKLSHNQKV